LNIWGPERRETTIRFVNARHENNMEGVPPIRNNFLELMPLCSCGNNKEKQINAEAIEPDAAKLILPPRIFHEGSFEK
jgi:hypothetical protein